MSTPLLSRKLDILYLIFFTIHIPVILLVDIVPLYPAIPHPFSLNIAKRILHQNLPRQILHRSTTVVLGVFGYGIAGAFTRECMDGLGALEG